MNARIIDLPPEIVSDMLETLRLRLERERENLVAEMRREKEEALAQLEAEAKELYRRLQEAYNEITRLREFERTRVTYEAERDEGSWLQ